MPLPLFTRATHDDGSFVQISTTCGTSIGARMPDRRPGSGEQYRFHVDMTSCIGCKCCVVACNEQNGNPATINWRRVGEVESGRFPATTRSYFSMACNHCVDPTCLAGCPVDAYTKDDATGIVRHSAETCIGCQYCTWTCSYGVPQFNPDRGVVGKCDMCYGRLSVGQAPACVSACPEGAIAVEIVNVADWRAAVKAVAADSGTPVGDASISTTRVTTPVTLASTARPTDRAVIEPADPHWPLVVMTVLTQLAAGAFVAIWIAMLSGAVANTGMAAAAGAAVAGLALAAATLHLGRPIHAYRAMKMWRRSWLSREVVLFGLFAHAAGGFAGTLLLGWPGALALGGVTALLGLAGVIASAYIYRVPSRPTWNTPYTHAQFLLTGTTLGSIFAALFQVGPVGVWRVAAAAATLASLVIAEVVSRRRAEASILEMREAERLLTTKLRPIASAGVLFAVFGGIVLPLTSAHPAALGAALALATAGELTRRYLFFVSAVPTHMTAPYLEARPAA